MKPLYRLVLFLLLAPGLIASPFLTPAEWVTCQHLEPDEALDFAGIPGGLTIILLNLFGVFLFLPNIFFFLAEFFLQSSDTFEIPSAIANREHPLIFLTVLRI